MVTSSQLNKLSYAILAVTIVVLLLVGIVVAVTLQTTTTSSLSTSASISETIGTYEHFNYEFGELCVYPVFKRDNDLFDL